MNNFKVDDTVVCVNISSMWGDRTDLYLDGEYVIISIDHESQLLYLSDVRDGADFSRFEHA